MNLCIHTYVLMYFHLDNPDESYQLEFKDYKIDIYAQTYFGIRNGLETLSQLISYDEITDSLQMHSYAFIRDAPKHSHRGILIDSARNFIPSVIIRNYP